MRDLLNQYPILKYLFPIGIILMVLLIGISSCGKKVVLPNVLGLRYEEAVMVLEDFKVKPIAIFDSTVPNNSVIAMNLPADQAYKKRTRVELTVAQNLELPDIMGMNLETAMEFLEGYEVTLVRMFTGTRANDSVIGMSLKPDNRYEMGSTITLQIEENIELIDVMGYDAELAVKLLKESGFTVEIEEAFEMFPGSQKDQVRMMDLSPYQKYPLNTTVALKVLRQEPVEEAVIVFKDQTLKMAVLELLDQKENISNYDVEMVTRIQVDQLVTSLEGLEHFVNLETLIIKNSSIGSLAPLSSLEALKEIYILGGGITDLGPLSHMNQLSYLNLTGNPIKDLSPIESLNIEEIIIDH